MQETRDQLHRDVGGLVRDARGVVDWRRNVKRYPWLAVGAAAALGYLIVPKRRKPMHLDAETLAELARTKRLVLRLEGETEKPAKVTDTLAATLLAVVGREAAGWLRKQAANFLHAELGRRNESRPRFPESESE
jgi:hypothetical protein